MKFNIALVLFFFIFTQLAFATPKKLEMIFLSPDKVSQLEDMMKNMEQVKIYKNIAQSDLDNCVPMGDGCFHPQLGFIDKKPNIKKEEPKLVKDEEVKLKTFNAIETNVVNCDKGNYFDIFCGKANATKSFANINIWFDISSSLRQVDYNKDPNFCKRRTFLEKVIEKCKSKVEFAVYNTSLKQISDYSTACMSYGTNDEKRLISWIKDSNLNQLLIITDVDEMSEEMKDFIETSGAKLIGDGAKAFTATDLVKYANEFVKACN